MAINNGINLAELEKQNRLPAGLLAAVMMQESGGNPSAVSPKGASGVFQFMPETAAQYGIDPRDPNQSARAAAQMYGELSRKYNGDLPSMLAGYNWGQGNVDRKGLKNAPAETRNYIKSVQSRLGKGTQVADAQGGIGGSDELSALERELADLESIQSKQTELAALEAELAQLENQHKSQQPKEQGIARPQTQPQENGILSRIGADVSKNISEGADILSKQFSGNGVNPTQAALQIGSKAASAVTSPIAQLGVSAFTSLPQEMQNYIAEKAAQAGQSVSDFYQSGINKLADTGIGKAIGDYGMESPNLQTSLQGIGESGKAAANIAMTLSPTSTVKGKSLESVIEKPVVDKIKDTALFKDISSGVITPEKPPLPTAKDAFTNSGTLYKQAQKLGAKFSPKFGDDIAAKAESLREKGFKGNLDSSEKTFNDIIDRVVLSKNGMDLSDFDKIDKDLTRYTQSLNQTNRRDLGKKLNDLKYDIREMLAKPEYQQGTSQGAQLQLDAISEWHRANKLADMENLVTKSQTTTPKRSLQTAIKNFLGNERKMRGYTEAEKEALKKAMKTGVASGLVDIFGSRIINAIAGAGAGAGTGGLAGSVAGAAVGKTIGAGAANLAGKLQAKRLNIAKTAITESKGGMQKALDPKTLKVIQRVKSNPEKLADTIKSSIKKD